MVGAIVPWNYPFEVTIQKLGQALATGNTMILKPAPDTPWNATRLGRLVAEHTDVPAGVFNVVASSDHMVGEELVIDPRVDLISFTGSTATGRRIFEKGAPDDEAALPGAGRQVRRHRARRRRPRRQDVGRGGSVFARRPRMRDADASARPARRYDEGIEIAAQSFSNVPYGDPTDMGNIQGPQVSAKQRDRVLGYIEKGVAEGARVVVGGGRPAHLERGYYVEPTLFADVDNSMTIAREEIFGPVLVVIPFEDDDDAVRIANDNQYGLGGYVTSGSVERAMDVGRRIRAGTISINGGISYGAEAPFGGYKASGVGRQNGLEGFEQYLETKTIAISIA